MSLLSKAFGDIITFTRASAATRVNAQGLIETVAANVPRIDYDPVTLECKGLLIEEQRTNLCQMSNNLNSGTWGKTSVTISSASLISPMGSIDADSIIEGFSPAFGYCVSNIVAGTVGATQTHSIYLKALGRSWAHVYFGQGIADAGAWFNLATGQVGTRQPNNISALILPVGGGWFRCSISAVIAAPNHQLGFGACLADNATGYQGDGRAAIGAFGGQSETGAFPTSYIPTAGAQVTRAADVAAINTLTPWFNQPEGSLLAEVSMDTFGGAYFGLWSFDQGFTDRLGVIGTPDEFFAMKIVYPSASDAYSVAQQAHTGVNKVACGWGPSGLSQATSGNATQTGNHYGVPQANRLKIGSYDLPLNGHVRKLRYFPKRLSDSRLQALAA